MHIQRIEEYLISEPLRQSIRKLLVDCFREYPGDRIYFKQLPDFRYLAWDEEELAGHMAVEHRVINNDGQVLRIFGVVDLCVAEAFQHRKLATQLLREIETFGRQCQVDFLMLAAKEKDLYESNGFRAVDNLCHWLLIQSHQTIGVVRRSLANSLMVKPLGEKEWKAGRVDFLGPIF
jgi:GNAT superfamily N-acetyltransferase